MKNRLFYGDCPDALKNSIEDESIDLIYIDPPFNSKRNYNVLFESIDMSDTKAQKEAFADTWSNVKYIDQLHEVQDLNLDLFKFLKTLDSINVSKSAVSYLTTMALRIIYMHRKLKQTGSFYLHCDQTMSHYLKLLCDMIFGSRFFNREIMWKKTLGHHLSSRSFDTMLDTILFYSKSSNFTFKPQFSELSKGDLTKKFPYVEEETGRRFTHEKLEQSSNAYNKDQKRVIQGREVTTTLGWRWTQETFNARLHENPYCIFWTNRGRPRYKRYADEYKGRKVGALWDDIQALSSNDAERLKYETQKPESLLERIIQISSNEGDVVADFFCGCGTAVAVAERLNRHWIGVDISHLAVRLMYNRVLDPYKDNPELLRNIKNNIEINGFPRDVASARELATGTKQGCIKFQDWIIEILLEGVSNPKKVGDGGYDGYFTIYRNAKERDVILIEVKSGNVTVKNVREFVHVLEHEKAAMGGFVCFEDQATKPMQIEAQQAGYYDQEAFGTRYPRVQVLTVEGLLAGSGITHPNPAMFNVTFKRARR
jgi:site-specific DNA-methyltransferase (adenine-specific)